MWLIEGFQLYLYAIEVAWNAKKKYTSICALHRDKVKRNRKKNVDVIIFREWPLWRSWDIKHDGDGGKNKQCDQSYAVTNAKNIKQFKMVIFLVD